MYGGGRCKIGGERASIAAPAETPGRRVNPGFLLSHYWVGLVQETPSPQFPSWRMTTGPLLHFVPWGLASSRPWAPCRGPTQHPVAFPCGVLAAGPGRGGGGGDGPTPSEGVGGKRQKNTYQAACLQINGAQTPTAPSAEGMHSGGGGDGSCWVCVGLGPSWLHLWPQSLPSERSPLTCRREGGLDVQVSLAPRQKGKGPEVRSGGAKASSPHHLCGVPTPQLTPPHRTASGLRRRLGDGEIGPSPTISLTPGQVRALCPQPPTPAPEFTPQLSWA